MVLSLFSKAGLLPKDQIPEDVMDEINAIHGTVIWDNYGKSTRFTDSKRLRYRHVEPINTFVEYEDPFSFDKKLVNGLTHMLSTGYRLRGHFRGKTADIYAVYSTGPRVVPIDY